MPATPGGVRSAKVQTVNDTGVIPLEEAASTACARCGLSGVRGPVDCPCVLIDRAAQRRDEHWHAADAMGGALRRERRLRRRFVRIAAQTGRAAGVVHALEQTEGLTTFVDVMAELVEAVEQGREVDIDRLEEILAHPNQEDPRGLAAALADLVGKATRSETSHRSIALAALVALMVRVLDAQSSDATPPHPSRAPAPPVPLADVHALAAPAPANAPPARDLPTIREVAA